MKKNKTGLFIVLGLLFVIGFSVLVSSLTGKEEVKFNNISYKEYADFYGEGKTGLTFVYVGKPDCGYCQQIQPLLGKLQTEEEITFNYLNTDTMSQENFEAIATTSKAFEGKWGTPTLIAIIDGKEHSNVGGYREIEDLRTFVKTAKSALKDE